MNLYKPKSEKSKELIIIINFVLFWALISKGEPFQVSIFNIYPNDLLATYLLIFGFFKLDKKKWNISKNYLLPIFIIFAILFLNFFIGYSQYQKTAFVHFRPYYYTFSAMLYFATLDLNKKNLKTVIKIFVFYCVLLLFIHFGKLLNVQVINDAFPNYSSQIKTITLVKRYLNSAQALFLSLILQLYISMIFIKKYKIKNIEKLFIFFLLLSIIFAQVRSVWLSFFLTNILFLIFTKNIQFKLKIFSISAILLLLVLIFYSNIHNAIIDIYNSFNEIFSYNSTAYWRIYGWIQLVHLPKGIEILKGVPFGTSYGRYSFTGQYIEFSPHNYYLHTFLATGLVGLFLFSYLLNKILFKNIELYKRSYHQYKLLNLYFSLIIVNYLIFFVSYDGTQIFGMLIGLSISNIRGQYISNKLRNIFEQHEIAIHNP